jgi:regulator of protease activity HflC (stomatin/prohibitin superfamily)
MNIPAETLGGVIASVLASVGGIFKAFKFVHEGERGIKLTFGRAKRDREGKPVIIEPGFVILVPFVQSLASHHVRQQSYRFPEQHVTLKDGLIYQVAGMVIFKVTDVYKALFDIESIDHSIDDLGMAAIRDELQQLNHEDLQDLTAVSKKLHERVRERANEWGIDIIQFSLPECAPTPETANLINAALGVNLRLKALQDGLKKHDLSLDRIDPNFAAVLIGVPMIATLSGNHHRQIGSDQTVESKDASEHILGKVAAN